MYYLKSSNLDFPENISFNHGFACYFSGLLALWYVRVLCFIFLMQMLYSWFQSAHVNHWVPSGEGMHILWSRLSWFTCYLLTILYHCFFWKWKLLSCVRLCDPKNCKPTSLLCPWTSPGQNTGVCCHSLLQGIFQTQGSKSGLLLCRQILYSLSHQGSLF